MKKLLLTFAILFSSNLLWSSHVAGAQIWYEHISSTANASVYRVHFAVMSHPTSMQLPNNFNLTVEPSTGSNFTLTVSKTQPAYTPPGHESCGTPVAFYVNKYAAFVTLNHGKNYKIYYQSCCRPFSISTMVNSSSTGYYIEAKINLANSNVRSYDNSIWPEIIPAINMIQGERNQVAINFQEVDGDSVRVELINAKEYTWSNAVSVTYAPGYSAVAPIQSSPWDPFVLGNDEKIWFRGTPSLVESGVLAYRIDNYVYDSVAGNYYRIGYITSDVTINSRVMTSPFTELTHTGYYQSAPTALQMSFSAGVYENSVSSDFSEFSFYDLNWQARPNLVREVVQANSNIISVSDSIEVLLDSHATSGNYLMAFGMGSDSTTLTGQCARQVVPDTFALSIPFVPAFIAGSDSVYNSGVYAVSDPSQIDSVTWSTTGGTIEYQGQMFSQLTLAPADSVFAKFIVASSNLQAIRWGVTDSDTLNIQITSYGVGMEGNALPQVEVYPNPARHLAQVTISNVADFDGLKMIVTDSFGRKVASHSVKGQFTTLHTDSWGASGVYWVQVQDDHGRVISSNRLIVN